MARNIISFLIRLLRFGVRGPGFFVLKQNLLLENEFELAVKLFFIGGAHDGCTQLFQGLEDLCVYVESDEMKEMPVSWRAAWALIFGMTVAGSGQWCSCHR